MGTLQEMRGPEAGRFAVRLAAARRLHAWRGAAACSGLAVHGPGEGSRICPPVEDAWIADCCEVLVATPEAMAKLVALPVWQP